MSRNLSNTITVVGIDIGKNTFHVVGQDDRGAIVLRQKWSRGQVEVRLANMPSCLIGMEACVGAHHLSRVLSCRASSPVPFLLVVEPSKPARFKSRS
jgi:transposase